jgi:hypothetical protein
MNDIVEWIKLLGGLAGLAALAWRFIDEFGSYLRITVEAQVPKDGWVTVLTIVDNKGNRPKDLSYAFLLAEPESESPVESATIIAKKAGYNGTLRYTNDFWKLRPAGPVYEDGRAFIPLGFFYSENVRIGDETLTYRAPIDVGHLGAGLPYAVRFFVFPKGRLHRSTHDCFVTERLKDALMPALAAERE